MMSHCRSRRSFIKSVLTASAAPLILPGSVLGLNGATAPSNKIVFGGIGMGNRAMYILPNFLSFSELKFAAVSDARQDRLTAAKQAIDRH